MDFSQVILTPEQLTELQQPFSAKEASDHFMLGLTKALSDDGWLPSEIESILKLGAAGFLLNPAEMLEGGGELAKNYALLGLGVGAVGGAYSGYARHRLEQLLAGNENPGVVELKRKIDGYHNMSADLKRTNRVTGATTPPTGDDQNV